MRLPIARLALVPFALVALVALTPWTSPSAAAHPAAHAATTNGTIAGTVLNGSKGNTPAAGQTVTLEKYVSHTQTQNAAAASTDVQGHFSFTGLDGSGSTIYQLDVRYADGDFTSAPIGFASGPSENQTITIYNTTSDPAVLSVTNTTMLFSPPNTKTGLIPVGVFITFKNSSKLAFAATTPATSGSMPTSMLRFALPPDAQNLALGAGFMNVQAIQVDKGFAAMATVPPGTTQFAYVYYLPYTGMDYQFQFQTVYPTSAVTLLVPTNIMVDNGDYAAKPPVQALGQQYQLLEADNVKADEVLKMRLWDLPLPGEQPDLDQRVLVLFGGILALLLALVVSLYLKRGSLAVALGIVPASALAKPTEPRGSQDREAEGERKRLLKLLLSIEKQHASGQLADTEYHLRRDNTRRKLKALLVECLDSASSTFATHEKIWAPDASQSARADFVAAGPPSAHLSATSALMDSSGEFDMATAGRAEPPTGNGDDVAELAVAGPSGENLGSPASSETRRASRSTASTRMPAKSVRRRRAPVGGRR